MTPDKCEFQMNNAEFFSVGIVPNIKWDIPKIKACSLLILNSNLIGCCLFLFAESSNLIWDGHRPQECFSAKEGERCRENKHCLLPCPCCVSFQWCVLLAESNWKPTGKKTLRKC